jgi:hypothetical protein
MVFFLEITNVWQKSQDFWFTDFILEIFKIHILLVCRRLSLLTGGEGRSQIIQWREILVLYDVLSTLCMYGRTSNVRRTFVIWN